MFSLYFTLQIKHDIKHKQKTTRETRGNLEQSFARELPGNGVGLGGVEWVGSDYFV